LLAPQRRSPLAHKKNDCAAAAPRERSVFAARAKTLAAVHQLTFGSGHITLQLSGGAPHCPARSKRRMKWRAGCAHVTTYDRPLELLVMCACHRTSPKPPCHPAATLLPRPNPNKAAGAAAERSGPHAPKLMSFEACHTASGAPLI
jgi:hypothetical protein